MRPYQFPLLAREFGVVRRTLLAATVLFTLAVLFVYVTFDPANRYRILAEPVMLRSLLLPGALLVGGLCAWLSFVAEMRSGTWDGWLLLPRSRIALIGAKVAVAIVGSVVALLVPVVVLWGLMRWFGNLGGPLIEWDELLFRSAFTQAALVAVTTYLASANAAVLARDGHVAFFAPLLLPLIATWRFFVGDMSLRGIPSWALCIVWLVVDASMLALVLTTVARHGRRVSATQTSLRALLVTPAAGVGCMIVGLLGFDVGVRLTRPPPVERDSETYERMDVGGDGTISTENEELGMYSLRTSEAWEERAGDRLRTPVQNLESLQMFRERGRNLLSAFDDDTGADLGCIGATGLAPCSEAVPFDSMPSVLWLFDGAAIVTTTRVHALSQKGEVTLLWEGDSVQSAVEMGEVLTLVGDGDLLVVRPDEENSVSLETACRGIVGSDQTLVSAVIVDHPVMLDASEDAPAPRPFAAARATFVGDASREELIVCRDGEVRERVVVEAPTFSYGERGFGRGDAQAMVVGPAADALMLPLRSEEELEGGWPMRTWGAGIAALGFTVLGGIIFAVRRKAFPWWVLPGLLLGPSYVVAGLMLLWRKARWSGLVGGGG